MTNLNKALQDTVGFGVEEFIKKALAGGWYPVIFITKPMKARTGEITINGEEYEFILPNNGGVSIFLDPNAWKAVGVIESWENLEGNGEYPVFRDKIHQFIDNLIKITNLTEQEV